MLVEGWRVAGGGQAGTLGCPRVAEGAPRQVWLHKGPECWPKFVQIELASQVLGWQVGSAPINPGLREK